MRLYVEHADGIQGPLDNVLGEICFSSGREPLIHQRHCLAVTMKRLDAQKAAREIWRCGGEIEQGQYGDIRYRKCEDTLFGFISLPETRFDASEKPPLQQAAEFAYRQIFELLERFDYPYLYRFWNYIADINRISSGIERYQQFNIGRQDAFLAHGRDVLGNAPAACALGTQEGPLCIAFIAGTSPSFNIENPRQISACRYPRQYGPRSPTFSRASLVRSEEGDVLFVSGTASIVGHETLHQDDVVMQARESMANIKAVLDQANRKLQKSAFNLSSLVYRVYIRNPSDSLLVREELTHIAGKIDAVYLQADICRSDLLLEIEAVDVLNPCKMS